MYTRAAEQWHQIQFSTLLHMRGVQQNKLIYRQSKMISFILTNVRLVTN